jgi:hypothetical protein
MYRERVVMKIGLKQIIVSLPFILGIADAAADSQGNRWDLREFARAFQVQKVAVERGDQRGEPRMPVPDDRGRSDQIGRQDTSGFGNQGDNSSNNGNDNSKKHGRMSPEERRALRRQIDEAGHDIYRPKR